MDNVVSSPRFARTPVQQPAAPEERTSIRITLKGKEFELTELIQIGVTVEGYLYFHTSAMTDADIVHMLEFVKHELFMGRLTSEGTA
jgi:hypothetical protein